jgi:hypothetical protein
MKKNKLKLKKRRPLSRENLFPKKVAKQNLYEGALYSLLCERFPDKEERNSYLDAVIDGLETEPIQEL